MMTSESFVIHYGYSDDFLKIREENESTVLIKEAFKIVSLEINANSRAKRTFEIPSKLHFREDSYRTTPLNAALALIWQKTTS